MARQEVNIGVEGNDGTGDSVRESFRKVNENFQEIYAVFGIGGQINFTNLSDTPEDYAGAAGNVIAVKQDELGLDTFELASNGALTGDDTDDTVGFDFSVPGKLILYTTFSNVQSDTAPQLGAPLNADNFAIGKVAVSDEAAQSLSAKFNEDFTIEDLVISKRHAGENYLKRGSPGATANLRDEPSDTTAYVFTIGGYSNTKVTITEHGLDSGSNGAAYKYTTTGTAATGLTNNAVYYIRIIDANIIQLYASSANALSNTDAITITGGTGVQKLTDTAYDANLLGNWLENEALPRKSVVRRQGDVMEGALLLSDHPGDLAGQGAPNAPEDLQAATKYYVDNTSFTSTVNLYVNTQGDDSQRYAPPGKDGRSLNYAFASVNKACEKAEELQLASPYEAGPYMQTVTYDDGAGITTISSAGIQTIVSGREPVKVLLDANKEFIQAEVIAYINETYPDFTYDETICARDIGYIIDSVVLDVLSGNNANYLSRWAGIRYYSNPSAKKAITAQYTETIAGIDYAKTIINLILQNSDVTELQSDVVQVIDVSQVVDTTARAAVAAKFEIVKDVINDGVLDAPTIVDGSVYEINITNGNYGYVDQGNPNNTDLLPGKLVIGKTSGARAIIVNYNYESDPLTSTPSGNDTLELQLVEPVEFVAGEEIEFGNTVRANQVTILVEAGVYYEDYPIKVPNNTSIKGDEFRRTIIRPKNRSSQSRFANIYYYRDKEFDGLAGDSSSITGFPDPNLPTTGTPYVNPLTGNTDGYFGYHYLTDPTEPLSLSSNGLTTYNRSLYTDTPELIRLNKDFIVEEVIGYVNDTYPALVYSETKCRRDTGLIVDAIVSDLQTSGREKTLEVQSAYYIGAVSGQETETQDAIEYIKTIAISVLANTAFPDKRGSVDQVIDVTLSPETNSNLAFNSLVDLVAYAFNAAYNPARNSQDLDVFLMNDATRLSNMTVQGHGGWMVVLDPEGQILTKSPYIQVGSSFSQSLNRQAFRGGMFIDAYTGNVPMVVTGKSDPFTLQVESNPGEGLYRKKPQTPAPFYLDGERFQVNAVREWDPATGTATLILDRTSFNGDGFTGTTSTLLNLDLDTLYPVGDPSAFNIVVQTAGNRSMLGNDFTQVNDLGYGLVVGNGALSEMVSMFTYYCWTAFYAFKGGEIRSLNGSNAYGEYGLVSEQADPNEIPDAVTLRDNMIMPVKTFQANVSLEFANATAVNLVAGDELTQAVSGAVGTVVYDVDGTTNTKVYISDITGTFDTTNTISVTSGTGSITGTTVPTTANSVSIVNLEEQLSVHVYDAEHQIQNRGEIELYHANATPVAVFGRYEVANFSEITGHIVGGHFNLDVDTLATYAGSGTTATFTIGQTRNGYRIYSFSGGSGYAATETIVIPGDELGGATPANDITITIDTVSDSGVIQSVSFSGTSATNDTTPYFDGQVYKVNFSTNSGEFSNDGLISELGADVIGTYRHNGVFAFDNVASVNDLVIRPSTAIQFDESVETTYRSITFANTEVDGTDLAANTTLTGFDINYDYVRMIVSTDDVSTVDPLDGAKTLGNTAGDTAIAIEPISETLDRARLDNGDMIFSWDGKVHVITGYTETGGDYDIIRFTDLADSDINFPASAAGLASNVVRGTNNITLRAGLQTGADATITINISTCRATGHDFLDIGTGGFNTSNYPNVLLGVPREPNQSNEVRERDKGRVFYVSTDQDGFFRVGKFFTVDQGTGTVTFSASIALSNLDGLGFKRGVVVAEFSTDNGMTNNASDIVPTQSAVRGYVNRRLGFDHNGDAVGAVIGPGVVPLDGSAAMTGTLNMANNEITNVLAPTSNTSAANKGYVDGLIGETDTLEELKNSLLTSIEANQLLVTTGFKRLYIDADTIGGVGVFSPGQDFTASVNGGTGTIKQVVVDTDTILGNINIIVYEDTSTGGNFIDTSDIISVTSGPTGVVIVDPVDEVANGIENASNQIDITVTRSETDAELALTYKADSIVNEDINSAAAISQSKLAMNAATTRANATGITQADLGLASFDSDDFTITDGWVTLKENDVDFADLPQVDTNKAIGNVSGSTGNVSAIDITQSGAASSLVRTQSDGSIRVNSLRLGGTNTYEILSLSSTTLNVKTPGQATVLTASGTDASLIVEMPGSLDIGNTGAEEGYLQENNGTYAGESRLAVDWIYSKVIEDADEKTVASTGIAIGANTGFTNAGEVGIFCKDGTTATKAPAIFSKDAMLPDTTGIYDIGSSTLRYATIYTVGFNASGNVILGNATSDTIDFNGRIASSVNPSATNTYDLGTSSLRWQDIYGINANFSGSVTLGDGAGDNVVFNAEVNSDVVPNTTNSFNLGASGKVWNTVYATLFEGKATSAQYADLAEMYAADKSYEPGTVVVFGGDAEVTLSDRKGDRRVAGVVSTNPAHLMNSELQADYPVAIALQGRVPCMVLGKVEKGDLIVTSAVPGFGVVDNYPMVGTIIGKALENKDDLGKGIVEVVVGRV